MNDMKYGIVAIEMIFLAIGYIADFCRKLFLGIVELGIVAIKVLLILMLCYMYLQVLKTSLTAGLLIILFVVLLCYMVRR